MDENGNVVRTIKEAVINNTTQTTQSAPLHVGQTSSSSSDTPKLNVVVYERDNISQSVQSGVANFPLATFNIVNPISDEDIKLKEIIFSLSDFAKNISELNVEIQLPIDDFGDSRKFIIGTKKFDLSKFQNISFDFSEASVIPAGKSVKIKILGNINNITTNSILGEYKNFVNLNYCGGNIINNDIPIVCDIGEGLIIPRKIYLTK